jgi:adenylylsulfate kinase
VCEVRDREGLYDRAQRGELDDVVGVDEPYEPPTNPEVVCSTAIETPEESAAKVIATLETLGYLAPDHSGDATAGPDEEAIKAHLRSLGYA